MSSVFENKYKKISAILKKRILFPLGGMLTELATATVGELSARHWLIK